MKLTRLLTVAAVAFAATMSATPALATTAPATPLTPEVVYALQVEPGGIALDARTVVWPALDMKLEVSLDVNARAAVGGCDNGRVCAFASYGATGTKLSWSSCGTHSTTALSGPVRSIANARSSGVLKAMNGTTTVASASAGNSANVYSAVNKVSC